MLIEDENNNKITKAHDMNLILLISSFSTNREKLENEINMKKII